MTEEEWEKVEPDIKRFFEEWGRPYVRHVPAKKRLKDYRANVKKIKTLKAKEAQLMRELACYKGAHISNARFAPSTHGGNSSPIEREILKREEIAGRLEKARQDIAEAEGDLQQIRAAMDRLEPKDRELLQRIYCKGESVIVVGADLYLSERAVRQRVENATWLLDYVLLKAQTGILNASTNINN